jgi:pantothenate kinase type III
VEIIWLTRLLEVILLLFVVAPDLFATEALLLKIDLATFEIYQVVGIDRALAAVHVPQI